eukprot:15440283-Alexandrium_andersonii.AAC.1
MLVSAAIRPNPQSRRSNLELRSPRIGLKIGPRSPEEYLPKDAGREGVRGREIDTSWPRIRHPPTAQSKQSLTIGRE